MYLVPGDLLYAVAPCGALKDQAALDRGLEVWRSRGYRVALGSNWNACEGYLAGSDELRRQVLTTAWQDPECKGILCTRGGYGSMRLLEAWHWPDGLERWVVGFSDLTGLLWSLHRSGRNGGVHAPVLTTLAAEPPALQQRLFDVVEGRAIEPLYGEGWGNGRARGWLLPANLTVATHLLGTPVQPDLTGSILALEDVSEVPYRVDRLLTHWRLSGALAGVCGIALGRFSRCTAPRPSWRVEEVLRDRLGDLGIPVVSGLPFGHDGPNAALPVGSYVTIDGNAGSLSWE
ncbi:uncharacterized protein KR51_00027710 [Rubidibacter lacunae KORDI 51-2]|uniref:Uncharacterized protein n=1 Tax=Rubidibacter lacunae KORDI 51-2 TaxID=582515 RepID=U5DIL2_9CHRO|nr:LD-carboxypeptidase [Rubidibacter lacunae]ERN40782.1 uncharacterized protein KR51_00027710 [Rubidibacter lacunae KORDI 51-2]